MEFVSTVKRKNVYFKLFLHPASLISALPRTRDERSQNINKTQHNTLATVKESHFRNPQNIRKVRIQREPPPHTPAVISNNSSAHPSSTSSSLSPPWLLSPPLIPSGVYRPDEETGPSQTLLCSLPHLSLSVHLHLHLWL